MSTLEWEDICITCDGSGEIGVEAPEGDPELWKVEQCRDCHGTGECPDSRRW